MNRFKKHLQIFIQNRRGSAVVELALAFPVLLLLGFGGFEMTRYILIQQKISKTVSSMSDLVARSQTISAAELDAMFQAVPHLMDPYYDATCTVVIVSSVVNYGTGATVAWQRRGGGTKTTASRIGNAGGVATLPAGFTMATNENVIISEIYYDFRPVVAPDIVAARQNYQAKFNMPRLGALDVLR